MRHRSDDSDLMRRVQAGDELAFELLFRRYEQPVYAYLWRRVHDEALAADLCQEVFVRLWKARTGWRPRGTVAGYLFRTANNLAIDEHRRHETRERWSQLAVLPASVPTPDKVLERRRLGSRLNEAIAALPDRMREVFSLKRDASLTYREIAELLEISPKTVDAHMTKATRRLRSALQDLR